MKWPQLLHDFMLGAMIGDKESEDWALAMLRPGLKGETGRANEAAAAYLRPYANSMRMFDEKAGAVPMMEGLVPAGGGTRPQLVPGGEARDVLDVIGAPSRVDLYKQIKEQTEEAMDRARLAQRARGEQTLPIVPQEFLDEAKVIATDVVTAVAGLPDRRRRCWCGRTFR